MALPRDLVAGQGLTWVGPPLPPPEGEVVDPGARGTFLDYEGDAEQYVVQFGAALFCCGAEDVRPDPRPPVQASRRHKAT